MKNLFAKWINYLQTTNIFFSIFFLMLNLNKWIFSTLKVLLSLFIFIVQDIYFIFFVMIFYNFFENSMYILRRHVNKANSLYECTYILWYCSSLWTISSNTYISYAYYPSILICTLFIFHNKNFQVFFEIVPDKVYNNFEWSWLTNVVFHFTCNLNKVLSIEAYPVVTAK